MAHLYQFSDSSEFLKFTYDELVNMIIGDLILSIAKGKFNERVEFGVSQVVCWVDYQNRMKQKKAKK